MRGGPFYPDHGLERIVDYHERQDARFAQAAADASERYDKPVLTATELAVTHPDNAGPVARTANRSEEHTSELQSLMRISYAVFCLKKNKHNKHYKKSTRQTRRVTI